MAKPVVNMTDWQVYVYQERYNLSGVADRHPRLGINTYVAHTSDLKKYDYKDETLTYETYNTIYVCPLKYINLDAYSNVISEYKEKLTCRADHSDNFLDKIIAALAKLSLGMEDDFVKHIKELAEIGQKEIEETQRLDDERRFEIIKDYEDCIYIEVSNIAQGDKLSYHLGDNFGSIIPSVHVGTYQDSILYLLYGNENTNECSLDFRYFPQGWSQNIMDTYSWSDNIKQAVIKNMRGDAIVFNGEIVVPGELKVFTPEKHKQGLISPDCYNGKSVLSDAVAVLEKISKNEK